MTMDLIQLEIQKFEERRELLNDIQKTLTKEEVSLMLSKIYGLVEVIDIEKNEGVTIITFDIIKDVWETEDNSLTLSKETKVLNIKTEKDATFSFSVDGDIPLNNHQIKLLNIWMQVKILYESFDIISYETAKSKSTNIVISNMLDNKASKYQVVGIESNDGELMLFDNAKYANENNKVVIFDQVEYTYTELIDLVKTFEDIKKLYLREYPISLNNLIEIDFSILNI